MKTKSKSASTLSYPTRVRWSDPPNPTWDATKPTVSTTKIGAETIRYAEGPRYIDQRCNWKDCDHVFSRSVKPGGIAAKVYTTYSGGKRGIIQRPTISSATPGTAYLPIPDTSELMDKFWDQIDLNCSDSVLLYSGVLQAVPLVGGCFKFVSIMNRLARRLSRDLRRKPFTTVVKTAISLDFINRFVVKPTLDDAQKFLDAHNYVVRVLNTMYSRQSVLPTAYEMESSNSRQVASGTLSTRPWSDSFACRFRGSYRTQYRSTARAFILANVRYNTSAVDPIRLWATRLGVTRPLDSAWDLVPFSFVVDYFTRAGDFISGLSDKMSQQDGLRGRIQRIHDSWITTSQAWERYNTYDTVDYFASGCYLDTFVPGTDVISGGVFSRHRFNPYACGAAKPHGFFSFDLSSMQKRTIAELVIQAKF